MCQSHGRVGGVDTLTSRSGCAEEVEADVIPLEVDIELAGFREDCDRSRRSLDPALGLGLWNALYTVDAGFIFHDAVDALVIR